MLMLMGHINCESESVCENGSPNMKDLSDKSISVWWARSAHVTNMSLKRSNFEPEIISEHKWSWRAISIVML